MIQLRVPGSHADPVFVKSHARATPSALTQRPSASQPHAIARASAASLHAPTTRGTAASPRRVSPMHSPHAFGHCSTGGGGGGAARRGGGGGGGASGTSNVDQSARGGRGCRGGLRRRGAGLAGWNPRFDDIGQAAVVGGRGGGATMRRYRVQGQEDGEEDGIQGRGPGFGVDGVGEGITRPGERGAALDEFLGRVLAGGLMPASVRNWMRSAGDGRAILAVLQMFANVAGAMMWLMKEGGEELVDFLG
jgi:hypothetical protein